MKAAHLRCEQEEMMTNATGRQVLMSAKQGFCSASSAYSFSFTKR